MSQDHISTEQQAVDKEKFDTNFTSIFGEFKKPKSRGYVQCPVTKKFIPREEYARPKENGSAMVMAPLQDFKSPIDGQIISTRAQLAEHNKRHGVTNSSDYSGGYIERKAKARNEAGEKYLKETRRKDINSAFNQFT